jgi:hypothetical protein
MTVRSRRSFLGLGIKISVVGAAAAALQACGQKPADGAAASGCVDLDSLTASEQSLRKSMNYAEKAPDATKTCSVCSFFTPGEGACGTCEIFTGGPANGGGHCDSWAAKPA